jgi:hypothetical protein
MKRFGDIFTYESVCFGSGQYMDCRLLRDIVADGHTYAYEHEVFPLIVFDSRTYEFNFFEDFDMYCPLFTLKIKS